MVDIEEIESSSSSDTSEEAEGNRAPEGPISAEEGDSSIFAAFQELQQGHRSLLEPSIEP